MENNVQIVKCEICGKEFDKSNRRNKSIHNLCSNECKYKFLGNLNRKHNKSHKSNLYGVWKSMTQRCYNKNDPRYKDYGGRGITICDEWKNNFQTFYDWSYSNGYSDEKLPSGKNILSIDRIDVNGNYTPSNCKWSNDKEQASNKQCSISIEEKRRICPICNKEFFVKQRNSKGTACSYSCSAKLKGINRWEKIKEKHKKECPVCHKVFYDRRSHHKRIKCCSKKCADIAKSPIWEFQGRTLRVVEWAEQTGINAHCLLHRKEIGWTIEEILTTPKGAKIKTK